MLLARWWKCWISSVIFFFNWINSSNSFLILFRDFLKTMRFVFDCIEVIPRRLEPRARAKSSRSIIPTQPSSTNDLIGPAVWTKALQISHIRRFPSSHHVIPGDRQFTMRVYKDEFLWNTDCNRLLFTFPHRGHTKPHDRTRWHRPMNLLHIK